MKYTNLLLAFCLLGVVDQIEGKSVSVEITGPGASVENTELPLWVFPCDVQEGDLFYVIKNDDVMEVRCGRYQG